jgi:hypothetical protein
MTSFTPLDFLAVMLASGAVIEVWHKGSIFDNLRARAQTAQDIANPESIRGRLLELLNCPFCKSYHVPLYLFLLLALADATANVTISVLVRAVVYGFGATRAGNLIDGLLPARMRYIPEDGEI